MTDHNLIALAAKADLTAADVLSLLKARGLPSEPDEPVGLGEHGIYQITRDGIRTQPVSDDELQRLLIDEQKALLEHERDARLDFPCSPADLVAWVERQAGEFALPDGFADAVRSQCPLSIENARRGGKRQKINTGLQEAINRIASELEKNGKKVTDGNLMGWFAAHDAVVTHDLSKPLAPYEFNPPISSCDEIYVDGSKLVWKDRAGNEKDIAFRSLGPYLNRAKKRASQAG